jgi:putative ABC transport system permease protein
MDFVESARMAWFTLKSNVLRTLLTTLGITIGIAAVIMMVGLGRGAQSYADQQFQSLGANLLFVLPGAIEERRLGRENTALTVADAEAVALQVPTIVDLAPAVSTRSPVVWHGQNTATTVIGTTPSFPTVRDFSVAQGEFFTWVDLRRNSRVVLLGSEVKTKLFGTRSAVARPSALATRTLSLLG